MTEQYRTGEWTPLDHLSHSSVNQLARCPQQWFWSRLMGNREPPSGALHAGSSGHHALEVFNNGLMSGTEVDIHQELDDYWDAETEKWDEKGWGVDWREEADEVIRRQVHMVLGKYIENPFEPAKVEEFHKRDLQEIFGTKYIKEFVGYIDLEDTYGRVGDYKFSTKKKNYSDISLDLQPFAYAFLLDRDIEFCFIEMLRSKTTTKDPFKNVRVERSWTERTVADIDWYLEQLLPGIIFNLEMVFDHIVEEWGTSEAWKDDEKFVKRISALFPATPNWACNSFCAYRKEGMCELRLGR